MSSTIIGVVKDGVVVPWSPLPEGAQVEIRLLDANPALNFQGHLDPNTDSEKEFLEELARLKREDFERRLQELDQECPDSSSTPTT